MPIQLVITKNDDDVYRDADRVIVGAPDPEPAGYTGRSPGAVCHELDSTSSDDPLVTGEHA